MYFVISIFPSLSPDSAFSQIHSFTGVQENCSAADPEAVGAVTAAVGRCSHWQQTDARDGWAMAGGGCDLHILVGVLTIIKLIILFEGGYLLPQGSTFNWSALSPLSTKVTLPISCPCGLLTRWPKSWTYIFLLSVFSTFHMTVC